MRAHLTRRTIAFLFCLAWPLAACADLVVIVHPDNPVRAMTPREVSDLYLGRSRVFDTGDPATPLTAFIYEHPAESHLRETFFRALNGMPISRLNAYWARLRFSGEVLPPVVLADSRAVIDAVGRNRNAIGYVDAAAVSSAPVKIVLRLKE
ncbi:MAG: hypothetical protein A3H93_20320 [Rhodocyclales bacterium RIFCSPLOWO2_02_FULL_63_24]|nr:MAG: hypothetical protein A3H93_20320 [Rhodocyclales bacterium RIFCSPLOWO2_02_FULL_63_24]